MKLCFIIAALLSTPCNATTLTVNNGDSIQAAVDKAMPGDIVNIEAGEYFQDVSSVRDGEVDKRITITGTREAILHGTGKENRLFQIHHDYITVNGFTIDGKTGQGDKESDFIDKLIYAHGNRKTRVIKQYGTEFRSSIDGLIISNMKLENAGGECVRLRYFITNAQLFGNHIENCGVWDFVFRGMKAVNGESIYIGTSSNQVNDGKNPTGEIDGTRYIHVHHNVLASEANELDCKEGSEFVLIEHNSCTSQKDVNSACLDSRTDNVIFRYNNVFDNDGAGVRIGGHTVNGKTWGQNCLVYGNTFHNNKQGALKVQTSPQSNLCENKCKGACKVSGSASDDYQDIEGKCPGVMDIFWVDETKAVDVAQSPRSVDDGEDGEPDEGDDSKPEPEFEASVEKSEKTSANKESGKCFPVEIKDIKASSEQGKNTVHAAIDGKALTRWSAEGKEEWLDMDFGSAQKIDAIEILFFKGDERTQAFEVFVDGNAVLEKQTSSGKTLAMQRFPFLKEIEGSSITIVGGGNSENAWNSLTEVIVCGTKESKKEDSSDDKICDKVEKLDISKVSASAADDGNKADNVIDGDLETRWSVDGPDEQEVVLELDQPSTISEIGLAVYKGDSRKAFFDVLVETSHGWEEVIIDGESVKGNGIESYDMGIKGVKNVKIVGYGNDELESGEHCDWNSFTEIELYGCV